MSVNKYNSATGELERIAGGTLYADAPIGSIQAYGGTTAPSGWLLCQGQAVSRTEYAELFAAIGIAFGAGDGSATFNVPDFRETVPVGIGENDTQTIAAHDSYTLGQFKDDQFQQWTATFDNVNNIPTCTGIASYKANGTEEPAQTNQNGGKITLDPSKTARTGTTTHGKQLGVNYIVKAKQVSVPFDVAEYIRNQNVLSDYEDITLSTDSNNPTIIPYDGFLKILNRNSDIWSIFVNGIEFDNRNVSNDSGRDCIPIVKGDSVYSSLNSSYHLAWTRYYKLRDYTGR
jgi:microcystin-dependent protein